MSYEQVTELPKEPIVVLLEAVLMPNGEIIYKGKSLLWDKELHRIYRRV